MFVRHFGAYELDEEQHHLRDLMAREDFRPGCNILRVMEGIAMPEEYSFEYFTSRSKPKLNKLAEKMKSIRIAWVVNNGRDYSLVHQWGVSQRLSVPEVERRTFRELPPALEWLGIPADYSISFGG